MLHEYSRLSFKLFCQGASCVISKKSWNYHPMQQQIDTTCQTPYIWATSMSYPTACKMWQNTRIHTHTHACVRVSTRHRSQGQPVSVRRHRQLVKVTTSAAPKKQGKTAILSFTLHFYSATFCTFTARPPKKRSNTKNIALLQRFAMQVTVPRLTKAPDSASPCLR